MRGQADNVAGPASGRMFRISGFAKTHSMIWIPGRLFDRSCIGAKPGCA